MKQKLTDNDPRLTAYALGELSREETEEVAKLLEAPLTGPLQREVKEIDALGVMLTQTLQVGANENMTLKLSPSQRDAIFRSAKAPTVADVGSTHQSAWKRVTVVTLAAAAVVTFSFLMLDRIDGGDVDSGAMAGVSFSDLPEDTLSAPIQPSDAIWNARRNGARVVSSQGHGGGKAAKVPHNLSLEESVDGVVELIENGWFRRADSAITRLPLACGRASWNLVSDCILSDGVLPDKGAVRLEEIVNAFHYDTPADLIQSFTSSGVELVRCPWNKERMVAVVAVENTYSGNVQMEAAVTFGGSVEKYRLVGYAKANSADGNVVAPSTITMGQGGQHVAIYEIETVDDIAIGDDVLSLDMRTSIEDGGIVRLDDEALKVQFSDRDWSKSSKDMQFAMLLAAWSQVVSGSDMDGDMDKAGVSKMIQSFEVIPDLSDQQKGALIVLRRGLELL